MPEPPNDGRSPLAIAMQWVHQITTVGVMMSLPAVVGKWLDDKWGTGSWLVAAGGLLGFAAGMWYLLRLTSVNSQSSDSEKRR